MQKEHLLFQTQENTKYMLWLFFYFTVISLAIVLSGYSLFSANDDLSLWNFLIAKEGGTLIMSDVLSILISTLYDFIPQIQWYSLTLYIYMSVISLLFAFYIAKLKDKHLKIILILLGTIILIHTWMSITITLVTLLLIVLSVPLIRNHQVGFWALLLLASFLRTDIIISTLPLLVIAYLLLFKKESLTKKKTITIFILFGAILFNYFSPALDNEYSEWLRYNKARTYFTDLNGVDEKNVLSEDEKILVYTWWQQDEILLPTEKVIQAAGSKIDVIVNRFSKLTIKNILGLLYRHPLLIFLILMTIYIVYKEPKNIPRALYILFAIGLLTLLLIRDLDRVTFPLIILWSILLFIKLLKDQEYTILKGFLSIAALILIVELPRDRVLKSQDNDKLKDEFVYLMNKYPMKYEPALGFPRSFGRESGIALKQNRLFDEDQWISYNNPSGLLPSGWIVRNSYFYRTRDISFKGEKRKHKTFYEFLIDENTGFIGSKTSDSSMNNTILRMYDKQYISQKNCHHEIKVLDESKHFSITQIFIECD